MRETEQMVKKMIDTIDVRSEHRNQMLDVTSNVQKIVDRSGIKDGWVTVFVPHTTAAITINENADPDVVRDILYYLEKLIPKNSGFDHAEGNSDAHIKTALVGSSKTVFISDGKLVLGTWQSLFFCEFDGPRQRKIYVKICS